MKPLIGITVESNHDPDDPRTRGKMELNWNYAQAVADAGGVPLVIPPMADMAEVAKLIDGWLIPGGLDIDACNFGEENHPEVKLQDPVRYQGEKALFQNVSADLPVFGICYGCQFLNVVRGGNLIQHLPDIEGAVQHTDGVMQSYDLDDASKLAGMVQSDQMKGKSYHHQAVKDLGEGLKVVAKNEDGTVEAI
ncbi:MAG TPA: gamma-glutamyl-gamma-aminobutyrate hydrolase family protein, partial [Fimbriimonas sp.]|nr:gamma-glutamyl-gamma-aminobutyrate hydrolase family protein [Fimbriimonas sp.]